MTASVSSCGAGRSVVLVGASLGGVRTAQELRALGFDGRITLIGAEPHLPYDRPPLSKQVLSGAWSVSRAALAAPEDLAALDVELRLGTTARAVQERAVVLADGERLPFTDLVIATGVAARRLPDQPEHPSVHVLRTVDDSLALKDHLATAQSLLVVGGGFIGAEVAAVARLQGRDVTMVEALPVPFGRVLGATVAERVAQLHRDHGVRIVPDARITRFVHDGSAVVVELADGLRLESDCVLVGVGTVPNTDWLHDSTVPCDNGVPCDASGRVVGHENVYAVGDVAAWADPSSGTRSRVEHWTSTTEQARVVAHAIAGVPAETGLSMLPYFWSDQYKIKLQLVGRPELAAGVTLFAVPDKPQQLVGAYFDERRLVAAVTFSAPHLLARFRGPVGEGADPDTVLRLAETLQLVPVEQTGAAA